MKKFTSKKQKIGQKGEQLAEMFLVKQGFAILDRNYSSRFGEIDLIARKDNKLHFFEIKTITVSHETQNNEMNLSRNTHNVPRETNINISNDVPRETKYDQKLDNLGIKKIVSRETFINQYRKLTNPFQNISKSKIKRSLKTIDLYMSFKGISPETKWQFDGIGVFLNDLNGEATFEHLHNLSII
jgi:Holliday junction resolvase-like predicted endonuclease